MAKLTWEQTTAPYEHAVDRGVLYPSSESAVTWGGLISVSETPSSDSSAYYRDGIKFFGQQLVDEFSASVVSYTYPSVLDAEFKFEGFTYRTMVAESNRIHLVYNPKFVVDVKTFGTIGDAPDLTNFTWNLTSTPVPISGYAPVSQLIIDFGDVQSLFVDHLETLLYGSDTSVPTIPNPEYLLLLFEELKFYGALVILDHGDGSWTAIGSDEMITMLDATTFSINSPSAIFVDANTYTLGSL